LRQGDIVGPIFLPLLARDITILGTTPTLTSHAPEQSFAHVVVPVEKRLTAVVSHDCEFNEEKRNKLLVARIQEVPGNLTDEERERLRASNDVEALLSQDPNARIAGVDSFVLAPLPGVFDVEQIVAFATITSLPMKMKDDLLAAKQAEMVHADRVRLRQKLAWFFGRAGDDLPDGEKTRPATIESPAATGRD
jgi:hypothetical protein